jgi:hypothetical protein
LADVIRSYMIQRVQSIYLLLSAIASAALFYVPLFMLPPSAADAQAGIDHLYYISTNSFLLILNIAIGVLSIGSIFLYKNRRLQLRSCRLCLLLIFLMVALLFYSSDTLSGGMDGKVMFKAGVYFPLIQIVFLFLAQRGIKKDEELVRSADRLR